MDTPKFVIRGEYITVTQLMKALNWVSGGSEAHYFIMEGLVELNGQVVTEKRRKLYPGDVVRWQDMEVVLADEE